MITDIRKLLSYRHEVTYIKLFVLNASVCGILFTYCKVHWRTVRDLSIYLRILQRGINCKIYILSNAKLK